jgi:ParB family chromosome partitioning protein
MTAAPVLIAVDAITPSRHRLRRDTSAHALESLAQSIKRWGQLQPVVVRSMSGDRYELICGERRWLAHKHAGLTTIWAVERDAADAESLVLALVENLQRVGLSQVEKMAALDQLAELTHSVGLRSLARQLRIAPSWLSSQLSVRRDAQILSALDAGQH